MLIEKILKQSKQEKLNVFFDMDGTLVEYQLDQYGKRKTKGANFYVNARPILYTIKIAKKLNRIKNISVHILSNCNLSEQIKEKTEWLAKYMSFLNKDNIHIICYENISEQELAQKALLKSKFIKSNFEFETNFLIEDDLKNINETNKFFNKNIAYHISSLIK